jgi:Ser/Thr protein kinase RdoA (MazF antagonist)
MKTTYMKFLSDMKNFHFNNIHYLIADSVYYLNNICYENENFKEKKSSQNEIFKILNV